MGRSTVSEGLAGIRRERVPYRALESAGDRRLEKAIRSWLFCEPEEVAFIPTRISPHRLTAAYTADPSLYLSDDTEGYRAVRELAELYRRGATVDPIVLAPERRRGYVVLEGWHRLCAAHAAGLKAINAYVSDRTAIF